jgi:hypothetical protein
LDIAQMVYHQNEDAIVFHPRVAKPVPLVPGTRVEVVPGFSGTDGGRQGVVLEPNSFAHLVNRQPAGKPSWKENPYGSVYGEPGRYKDFDPSKEVLIRDDAGKVFGMFKDRVRPIPSSVAPSAVSAPQAVPPAPARPALEGAVWLRQAVAFRAETLESGAMKVEVKPEELDALILARHLGVSLAEQAQRLQKLEAFQKAWETHFGPMAQAFGFGPDDPRAIAEIAEVKTGRSLIPGPNGEDFRLKEDCSAWVGVDEVAVHIHRKDDCVCVALYPNNNEMADSLADVVVSRDQAREAGGTMEG